MQRAGRVAAIPDRHELPPSAPGRAMIRGSELEAVRASGLCPRAHDVLLRPDIHAIPGLVFRVPAIEVVMVVGDRDEVLGAGLGVQPDQLLRFPVLRMPEIADVFVPELRRVPVGLDVVVVLGAALYVHAAGVPIPLLGNALRSPVSPDSELRIAEPVGVLVSLQRFPIGPERARDRAAGKIAVGVCALLTPCGPCGREQAGAARDELSPVETGGVAIHFQITPLFIKGAAVSSHD